jgi:hypothetical protein
LNFTLLVSALTPPVNFSDDSMPDSTDLYGYRQQPEWLSFIQRHR